MFVWAGRISIASKLYGILGIVMVLVAAIGLFAFYKINLLASLNTRILSSPYTIGVILRDIDAAVMSIERDLSLIPYEKDKYNQFELISLMSENHDKLMVDIRLMNKKVPEHKKLIEKTKVLFEEWKLIRDKVIKASRSGDFKLSNELIQARSKSYVAKIDYLISQIRDIEVSKLHALSQQSRIVKESVIFSIIVAFLVLLGVALGLVFIIARSIAIPTKEIANTMKKISDGSPKEKVPYLSRKDEIGAMARATEVFRQYSLHILDLNEELKVTDRLKTEFFSNMNHEMRTPLNGILGMCQILKKNNLTEKQARYIRTIYTSGEKLLAIVNDMLDLSKLEAGLEKSKPEEFDIYTLIQEGLDIAKATAFEKNIIVSSDIQEDCLGLYSGYAEYIKRVLINFIGNAVKFTDEGSIYFVVTSREAERVRFEVTDTGIGIDESNLKVIFERFRQVDGSDTRIHGGTGLGLAICQDLVKKMDGEIGVESEVGVRSCFWFEIPLQRIERAA